MKYYTGTKKRRYTRKSKPTSDSGDDGKQPSTDESNLQKSPSVDKINPRKRGRPRTNSNLEQEQSSRQVKRSKSDLNNESKSAQKGIKSKRSKAESEDEEEGAEKAVQRPSNMRKRRSTSSDSNPVEKTSGHQSKANISNKMEAKSIKSSITDQDQVDGDDVPTAAKQRSKRKTQETSKATSSSGNVLIAPKVKETSISRSKERKSSKSEPNVSQSKQSKRSNKKSVKCKDGDTVIPSAELSGSTFEDNKPLKKPEPSVSIEENSGSQKRKPANRNFNNSRTKKSSNLTAEDPYFEDKESTSRSKNNNTSSTNRKNRSTYQNSRSSESKKSENLGAEISDSDDAADVYGTTSKDNSSLARRNRSSNRVSRHSKTPITVSLSSHSTHEVNGLSTDDVSKLSTESRPSTSSRGVMLLSAPGSDGWQSDREFLQQQVNILMTPFEVTECPVLATVGRGRKRKKNEDHLPQDIIAKSLRKWNYKVEDELLKTLNRQSQRRILHQIQEIKLHSQKLAENNNDENKDTSDLESLQRQLASAQVLKDKAAKLEKLMEGIDSETLLNDIKHSNRLMQTIQQKIKTQGMTDFPAMRSLTRGPTSHQEIVNKLFPK